MSEEGLAATNAGTIAQNGNSAGESPTAPRGGAGDDGPTPEPEEPTDSRSEGTDDSVDSGEPEDQDHVTYRASVYQSEDQLPDELVAAVQELEAALDMPVFFLIQDSEEDRYRSLTENLAEAFFRARESLPENKPVAVLVDSGGGQARAAYRIVMTLRKRCNRFVAVVPRRAKSAATLLSLGADCLMLGDHAELGPMDVQVWDPEEEGMTSALNELQSLESLHNVALGAFDDTMLLLTRRTGKKTASNIPHALEFIAGVYRPLMAKLDAVRYSQRSRQLRVGEDYLVRLLLRRYEPMIAASIARHLVNDYSDHNFLIDHDELERLVRLVIRDARAYRRKPPSVDPIAIRPPDGFAEILDRLFVEVQGVTVIGLLTEETTS